MRCQQMGATCVNLEPPSGDPMGLYNPSAYAQLHTSVRIAKANPEAIQVKTKTLSVGIRGTDFIVETEDKL